MSNEAEKAARLSASLRAYFERISEQLTANGALIVFSGGDSVLAKIETIPTSNELEKFYLGGPCTISIGIGSTPEVAYLALQLAKARGKNQAVFINEIHQETIFFG